MIHHRDRISTALDRDPGPDLGLRISEHWAGLLLAGGQSWDREAYKAACATLGEEVTWEPRGRGRAVDVDETGGLVIESARGSITVRSGEVHTVRPV